MKLTITTLCMCCAVFSFGQTNVSTATISANRVKASVRSDGRLFDGGGGQFIAPFFPQQPERSLMRGSGLLIGARQPDGSVLMSATLPGVSDFTPGILDPLTGQPVNQLNNKIWRVTRAEIEAHIADYTDDNIVSNPQNSVYAWPGRGNPYFSTFNNGDQMPMTSVGFAEFFDRDEDGIYDPSKGDYPSIAIRGCLIGAIPDEILWFAMHDRGAHNATGSEGLGLEIHTTIFVYNCDGDSPVGNSVFVQYKLINRATVEQSNTFFGVFNEFGIGGNNDDFVGCDTTRFISFGYNGDLNDENGFGEGAPVMCVESMRGPLNAITTPSGDSLAEFGLRHIVPFVAGSQLTISELFNLLNGRSIDGSLLANDGKVFPDSPLDVDGFSEVTANNVPGSRGSVLSYGAIRLMPGAVNEIMLSYSYAKKEGLSALDNTGLIYTQSNILQNLFDNCFYALPGYDVCGAIVDVPIIPEAPVRLTATPNPTFDRVNLVSENAAIAQITLTDIQGRILATQRLKVPVSTWPVDLAAQPDGIYLIKATLDNGQHKVVKIVKNQ